MNNQKCRCCLITVDDPDIANDLQFNEKIGFCAYCEIALRFLNDLDFVESEFKDGCKYWFYADYGKNGKDYKFVPIIEDDIQFTTEINNSPYKEELKEILTHLNEQKEFYPKEDQHHIFRKSIVREIARFKWFDKYKELMPYMSDIDSLLCNWSVESLILLVESEREQGFLSIVQ